MAYIIRDACASGNVPMSVNKAVYAREESSTLDCVDSVMRAADGKYQSCLRRRLDVNTTDHVCGGEARRKYTIAS